MQAGEAPARASSSSAGSQAGPRCATASTLELPPTLGPSSSRLTSPAPLALVTRARPGGWQGAPPPPLPAPPAAASAGETPGASGTPA
jgi:hypothetical protein